MMVVDAMIDIETLGNFGTPAILSIGAARFDPLTQGRVEIDDVFYTNVDIESCLRAGLEVRGDNIYWWLQQSEAAREGLSDPVPVNIKKALHDLAEWYRNGTSVARTWSHGATYDLPILANAYERVRHSPPPWPFRSARDTRTLFNLAWADSWYDNEHYKYRPPGLMQDDPLQHRADADAVRQCYAVQDAFAQLRLTQ